MTGYLTTRSFAGVTRPRLHQAGFTLVELMVAMVLGLIVIGAVLALVLSMLRSNKETIAATRLTQELRATAAVVTSELQRAGSTDDPFALSTYTANAIGTVDTATANCIKYRYVDGTGTTRNSAISLSGGAVYLDRAGGACGAGGTKLSSSGVSVTALTFARSGQKITVALSGKVPDSYRGFSSSSAAISRSYSQTVFAPGLGST